MSNIQFELACVEGNQTGARCLQTFDRSEQVRVRDNLSRQIVSIKAAEVSLYRHTILIETNSYRIMQVFN